MNVDVFLIFLILLTEPKVTYINLVGSKTNKINYKINING